MSYEMLLSCGTTNGLLDKFGQGNTCLGMFIAVEIFSHLENLSKPHQERKQIVSRALAPAETVKCAFTDLGREEKFDDIFERCNSYVEELDLEPVKTQRIRKPPKKYFSEANCHVETDARKYFHNQFYEARDTAVVQTGVQFQQSLMEQYKKIGTILIPGEVSKVVDNYLEIDSDSLKLQVSII
ncbi:hypothetical protein PR048_026366 [Dryococelus australis]|uniref:Uncharacterized protein n=1 Tax=Dryococelus australis TaxID=614101 RepID=A0ABQ9GL57_9NEOP|nr:hypothetical protein PR048_026366 [Dryococelus australis]